MKELQYFFFMERANYCSFLFPPVGGETTLPVTQQITSLSEVYQNWLQFTKVFQAQQAHYFHSN